MGTNTVSFAGDGSTPESPVNFNGADGVIFVLDSAVLNVDDITKSSAADLVVNVKLGDKSEAFVANNSLTKTGAGTVRLTKVNEFTGPTTVSAGATGLFEFSAYNEDPALQSYDRLIIGSDGSFVIDENSIIKLYFENGDADLWAAEGEEYKLVSDEGFADGNYSALLEDQYRSLFELQGKYGNGLYLIGGLGAVPIPPGPEPGSGVPEPSTWALLALGVIVLYLRRRVRS